MTESENYEVGYARPPKTHQWKKGQSGNPNRQYKRAPKGTVQLIEELFTAPMKILVDGRSRTVSTLEVILTQLMLKEMAGNRRAFVTRLRYQEFITRQRGRSEFIIRSETGFS